MVWARFGIRFEVRVSFRVNYFKESLSVLLCAQNHSMLTVRCRNHSLVCVLLDGRVGGAGIHLRRRLEGGGRRTESLQHRHNRWGTPAIITGDLHLVR